MRPTVSSREIHKCTLGESNPLNVRSAMLRNSEISAMSALVARTSLSILQRYLPVVPSSNSDPVRGIKSAIDFPIRSRTLDHTVSSCVVDSSPELKACRYWLGVSEVDRLKMVRKLAPDPSPVQAAILSTDAVVVSSSSLARSTR